MTEEKDERLEKLLGECESPEAKAIMGLLPVLERDFAIVYNELGGCAYLKFSVVDSRGETADIGVLSNNSISIRHGTSPSPDYSLRIKKDRKGDVIVKAIFVREIIGCKAFGEWDLAHFLKVCGEKSTSIRYASRVARCLDQISSLPSACLEYIKQEKKAQDIFPVVAKARERSLKLAQAVDMSQFYFDDPEKFKSLFERLDDEEKKKVLHDIILKDEGRKDLDKWLEEKHPGLIEESWRERNYGEK